MYTSTHFISAHLGFNLFKANFDPSSKCYTKLQNRRGRIKPLRYLGKVEVGQVLLPLYSREQRYSPLLIKPDLFFH